ncbi:hypothetical protein CLOP_g20222 [Closterium sp. NIES-67]|nr:hypothetical protein CLOP_g20222 [Closterium sp. NIES-67]
MQALAGGRDKAARRKARAVLRVRRHGNLLLAALLLASCLASTLAAAAFTELLGVGWGSLCAFSLLFLCAEILPPALCTNRSLQVAGATAWAAMAALIVLFPAAWPVGLLLDWLVAGSGHTPDYGDGVVKCCLAPEPQQQEDDEGGGDACNPGEKGWGGEKEWGAMDAEGEVGERRCGEGVIGGGGGRKESRQGEGEYEWEGQEGTSVEASCGGARGDGGEKEVCRKSGGEEVDGMGSGDEGASSGRAAVQMVALHSSLHAAPSPSPSLTLSHAALAAPPSLPPHAPPPFLHASALSCPVPPAGPPPPPQSPPAPPPWFLQSWEHAAVWARLAAVPPTPVAPGALPGVSAPAVQAADRSAKARGGDNMHQVSESRGQQLADSTAPPAAVPPLPLSSSTPLWRHRPSLPAAGPSSRESRAPTNPSA